MAEKTRKKISILGDSISTFEGYSPAFGAFYTSAYSQSTNILSVEDTWWMKVIHALDGTLLVNDSHAGSSVSMSGYQPASAPWRISKLKKNTIEPDLILIYSGLNDVATYVTSEVFGKNYRSMLQHCKIHFPQAAIWCGTLCRGYLRNPDLPLFVNLDNCSPLSAYNQAIRDAVCAEDCFLADLDAFDEQYSSIDGIHPDAGGMALLASLWLRCLLPAKK